MFTCVDHHTVCRTTEKVPFLSAHHAQKSSMLLVHKGIDMIVSASKGKNVVLMRSSFHVVVVPWISSDIHVGQSLVRAVIGLKGPSLGNQFVSQMFVF